MPAGQISLADIRQKREQILAIASRHGASDVRLFGSIARGESASGSDVDFVVGFEAGRSLFDQGELALDLSELLGVNVDVVSAGALVGRFGEAVRSESVSL